MKEKLCLATNNKHKLAELKALLPSNVEILSLVDIGCNEELEESGSTFRENALQKAGYIAQNYQVNSLADDSGLVVPALSGAPGVYSARYAGSQRNDVANLKKLLKDMEQISDREAYFISVLCLVRNGNIHYFEGKINGRICHQPIGEHGFGYDPIFIPDGFSNTFAQMEASLKNSISHRGKAMRQLENYYRSV